MEDFHLGNRINRSRKEEMTTNGAIQITTYSAAPMSLFFARNVQRFFFNFYSYVERRRCEMLKILIG